MTAPVNIPLKASFGGWKFAPWFAWGSNNMKPKLILHSDAVEFRLFRLRRKPYTAIAKIDYRSAWRTENIVIEFSDSVSTFIGNTGNRDVTKNAIRMLHDKGCLLSEAAASLIAGS